MEGLSANSIRASAEAAGQGQIFKYWQDLNDEEKSELIESAKDIDFELVNSYYRRLKREEGALAQLDAHLQPLPHDRCGNSDSVHVSQWYEKGLKQIRDGKVAVLLLAGGQGTRLGSINPKGMYNLDLPSGSTLYQLQAESIRKLQQQAQGSSSTPCVIPWYIMTSEATQEMTEDFFAANGYFGLDKSNIFFFQQSTLPCLDFDGKIILEAKSKVSQAPDGNGGLYKALLASKALDDMKRRGIVHIHLCFVDNVLARLADPVFVGYCIEKGADCACKVVAKQYPSEAVGVVCLRDGHYAVVEYSEISEATAQRRNEAGRLTYDAANIGIHYFTIDFLERLCRTHALDLPLHTARKQISAVNEAGESVRPPKPNGIKMEMFVFDVFQYSNHMAVMYVDRQEEFSPLKNGPGASSFSPSHCRNDYMARCRRWVRAAKGTIADNVPCEISPLVSYNGEDLTSLVADQTFTSPVCLKDATSANKHQ